MKINKPNFRNETRKYSEEYMTVRRRKLYNHLIKLAACERIQTGYGGQVGRGWKFSKLNSELPRMCTIIGRLCAH